MDQNSKPLSSKQNEQILPSINSLNNYNTNIITKATNITNSPIKPKTSLINTNLFNQNINKKEKKYISPIKDLKPQNFVSYNNKYPIRKTNISPNNKNTNPNQFLVKLVDFDKFIDKKNLLKTKFRTEAQIENKKKSNFNSTLSKNFKYFNKEKVQKTEGEKSAEFKDMFTSTDTYQKNSFFTKGNLTKTAFNTSPNFNKNFSGNLNINKIDLKLLKNAKKIKEKETLEFKKENLVFNSTSKIKSNNLFVKTFQNTCNNFMQKTYSKEKEVEKFSEFKSQKTEENCLIVQNTQDGKPIIIHEKKIDFKKEKENIFPKICNFNTDFNKENNLLPLRIDQIKDPQANAFFQLRKNYKGKDKLHPKKIYDDIIKAKTIEKNTKEIDDNENENENDNKYNKFNSSKNTFKKKDQMIMNEFYEEKKDWESNLSNESYEDLRGKIDSNLKTPPSVTDEKNNEYSLKTKEFSNNCNFINDVLNDEYQKIQITDENIFGAETETIIDEKDVNKKLDFSSDENDKISQAIKFVSNDKNKDKLNNNNNIRNIYSKKVKEKKSKTISKKTIPKESSNKLKQNYETFSQFNEIDNQIVFIKEKSPKRNFSKLFK